MCEDSLYASVWQSPNVTNQHNNPCFSVSVLKAGKTDIEFITQKMATDPQAEKQSSTNTDEKETKNNNDKYEPGQLYVIGPKLSYDAVVIFLHGLGDTGSGWKQSFKYFSDQNQYIKFIFPTAPLMAVDIHGGGKSRAWHNITSLKIHDLEKNKFEKRDESYQYIKSLIDNETMNENNPIPLSRIILAGFSQGAAMALYTSLLYPFTYNKLGKKHEFKKENNNDESKNDDSVNKVFHNNHFGGLIMLSGYCPHLTIKESLDKMFDESKHDSKVKEVCRQMPIFMGHGNQDLIVDKAFGTRTFETVKTQLKYSNISWKEYDVPIFMNLGHGVNDAEINEVRKFILQKLPDPYASGYCQLL